MSAAEGKRPAPDKAKDKLPAGGRPDEELDEELDEALEESFPASDPPSPALPRDHPGGGASRRR